MNSYFWRVTMGFMMMTVTQYQEICDRKVEFG